MEVHRRWVNMKVNEGDHLFRKGEGGAEINWLKVSQIIGCDDEAVKEWSKRRKRENGFITKSKLRYSIRFS